MPVGGSSNGLSVTRTLMTVAEEQSSPRSLTTETVSDGKASNPSHGSAARSRSSVAKGRQGRRQKHGGSERHERRQRGERGEEATPAARIAAGTTMPRPSSSRAAKLRTRRGRCSRTRSGRPRSAPSPSKSRGTVVVEAADSFGGPVQDHPFIFASAIRSSSIARTTEEGLSERAPRPARRCRPSGRRSWRRSPAERAASR